MDHHRFNPDIHHRRSIRLTGYDYGRSGAYFVTVCSHSRECVFGSVAGGSVRLNDAGRMVESVWNQLFDRFPNVQTDQFIVMPNHIHGIIVLNDSPPCRGESRIRPKTKGDHKDRPYGTSPRSIGRIIQAFKSITTHRYIKGITENHWPLFHKRLWQRNYFERVIRGEAEMRRVREYILQNPLNWETDEDNPDRPVIGPMPE